MMFAPEAGAGVPARMGRLLRAAGRWPSPPDPLSHRDGRGGAKKYSIDLPDHAPARLAHDPADRCEKNLSPSPIAMGEGVGGVRATAPQPEGDAPCVPAP